VLAQSLLDELWVYDDPALSERRLTSAADSAHGDERLELITQVARAAALRGEPERAMAILDDIDSPDAAVCVRVALERGRIRWQDGAADAAIPLFLEAVGHARRYGLTFLEVDALHMLALSDRTHAEQWTLRGLSTLDGSADSRTHRWAVALHSDYAWVLHDSGRLEAALAEFGSASAAADLYGTADERRAARFATARCLRSLGRVGEARSIQRELLVEFPTDGHVIEELGILEA
jgi:tetratricopeptide (TPR) repeat protein